MHLEGDPSNVSTEADVESKILIPLLLGAQYLAFESISLKSKNYLQATILDKLGGKAGGYYPDFSIWQLGFLLMVVEAKAPSVDVEVGYREASLYARHVNQQYRSGLSPCRFLVACNGVTLLAGYDDASPALVLPVSELQPATTSFQKLVDFCCPEVLLAHAAGCVAKVRVSKASLPFQLAGGPSLLTTRKPLNTFAPDLSPVLRRYFSTNDPAETLEVVEKAYVSTAEITEYDRVLESLLKDRITTRSSSIVKNLAPTRRGETIVTNAIDDFNLSRPEFGQLQIIQGAVGSGKSIFIRRYKEFLQPSEQIATNKWSFINFLGGPISLKGEPAQKWLCQTFCESFYKENPGLDPSLPAMHRGIYSRKIMQRKPIYEAVERDSPEHAARLKAEDMIKWQDDYEITARGLAEYILGSRQETLITVMDNVDKLGLQEQLDAFELSLWFLNLSRSFVILQMRDETYERFKDRPPLDTYRASVSFHITPPRFIDVVKPRLDLGIAYLLRNSSNTQTYELDNGLRVTYPNTSLGEFIRLLYAELFGNNRNVARLMESLAGTDVRKALEIFSSIITSGHLSTTAITSVIRGEREFPITEVMIIKILMRTVYRIFSSNSGFITNIFFFDNDWEKPDNFLVVECLFYLALKRNVQGQIGIEGFFTCEHIAGQMQILGYSPSDTLSCLNFLLERDLISADHQSRRSVSFSDTVRILPSGFMHLRPRLRMPETVGFGPDGSPNWLDVDQGTSRPAGRLRAATLPH